MTYGCEGKLKEISHSPRLKEQTVHLKFRWLSVIELKFPSTYIALFTCWYYNLSSLLSLSFYLFTSLTSIKNQLLSSPFSFFQRIDGRTIYAEIAKPVNNGFADYPITSGPPSGRNQQPNCFKDHSYEEDAAYASWMKIYKSLHICAWSGSKFCNRSATATAMEDSTAVQTETGGLKSSFQRKQGEKNRSYSASNKTCSVHINARIEACVSSILLGRRNYL